MRCYENIPTPVFAGHISIVFLLLMELVCGDKNLTCYQCTRTTNVECSAESLLPCPPVSDRCVTHVAKDPERGFTLKRECGLGPCGFDDDMVNRGLGLDACDRSKDSYFCVSCCRGNGCNKSLATTHVSSAALSALAALLVYQFHYSIFC